MSGVAADRAQRPISFAAPFRHSAFTVIWTATLVSNVGGWMYSAASGWLMTSLDPDPLMVALVQAASSLPICLFAIPAGALADIFDKRRFLIVVETITTVVSAVYAVIVGLGWATPANLLVFTFLIGAAGAMTVPAWQAVVTYLVPKDDLPPAIAANSVGVNISRAIGPALGGLSISAYGIVAPFWINAASNLGIVASLLWWRPRTRAGTLLPAERFGRAILAGLRYARHNRHLRATLMRAAGFFLFASAYWALLPLVAREQIGGGPDLYGVLLGVIGAGAVAGAFLLPWAKARLGADRLMALGALGQALAMVLYGFAREPLTAVAASAVAGASWIGALATLKRLGPGGAAGLGAGARTGAVYDGVFRLLDVRQRRVGRSRRARWACECAFSRCCRRRGGGCADLALEAANRRGLGSVAVDALAGALDRAADRKRSRPGVGDGRISNRSRRTQTVP